MRGSFIPLRQLTIIQSQWHFDDRHHFVIFARFPVVIHRSSTVDEPVR